MIKKIILLLCLSIATPALFANTTADQTTQPASNTVAIKKITLRDQKSGNEEVNIFYPELQQAPLFNRTMKDFVADKRAKFKTALNVDSRYGNTMYIDYDTAINQLKHQTILSVVFNSEYFTGGAHPWHEIDTFNYDVNNNRFLTLQNLFTSKRQALKIIAKYCYNNLKQQFKFDQQAQLEWLQKGTLPSEKNYQHWTLTKEGIMIYFDEYQVAAYVYGRPTVLVPFSQLNQILIKD